MLYNDAQNRAHVFSLTCIFGVQGLDENYPNNFLFKTDGIIDATDGKEKLSTFQYTHKQTKHAVMQLL